MAYTQGFENDVFISYCHRDNLAHQWVEKFQKALQGILRQKLRSDELKVWRDDQLHSNSIFDQKIKHKIDTSALFLVLLSRNYLDSDYCKKELQWFYSDERRIGLSIDGESRIYKVLLNNIPHNQWPRQLVGSSAKVMHNAPEGSQHEGDVFDHESRAFRETVNEITTEIAATLNAIPGAIEPEQGTSGINLFIAETADSLQEVRERLIEDLTAEGIHILRKIPPPYRHKDHDDAVKKAITGAQLTVHLMNSERGRKIDDFKESTYPCRQLEIGLETKTQQLIWMPKALTYDEIKDEGYSEFLQNLEYGERQKENFNFVSEPETGLIDLIIQKTEEIRQQLNPANAASRIPLLLTTHSLDLDEATNLTAYLKKKGIAYRLNPEYEDIESSLKVFDECLLRSHNVVIVYGAGGITWVKGKLLKTIQMRVEQMRERFRTSLENLWLYRLPSSCITEDIEQVIRHFNVQLLDNSHSQDLDETVLEPLLKSCGSGSAA